MQNLVKDARTGLRRVLRANLARRALPVGVALLVVPFGAGCSDGSAAADRTAADRTAAGSTASGGTASGGTTSGSTTSGSTTSGASEVPGAAQVTAAVRSFYTRYETDPSKQTAEQYLTDAALAAVFASGGDSDRVYCAQNVPASVSYDPPVMAADRATVVVTTHWGASPDRRITVTVALPEMLISKITCPA